MSGLDLFTSQSSLWYMLLVATVVGALLGVLCDGFFILRVLLRDPRAKGSIPTHTPTENTLTPTGDSYGPVTAVLYAALRGVCDFLSVILATVLLLLLCYYTSDGQLRAPAFFGMTVGFWGYHKTVSRPLRRLSVALLDRICRLLRFLWKHTLGRLLACLFGALGRRIRNAATARRITALTGEAAHGFGISKEPPSPPS